MFVAASIFTTAFSTPSATSRDHVIAARAMVLSINTNCGFKFYYNWDSLPTIPKASLSINLIYNGKLCYTFSIFQSIRHDYILERNTMLYLADCLYNAMYRMESILQWNLSYPGSLVHNTVRISEMSVNKKYMLIY